MKLNFGQEALVLPGAVLSCCDEAEAVYLRVLLWLSSDLTLGQKPKQLAKLASCDQATLAAALSFWREKGILADTMGESVPAMATLTEATQTDFAKDAAPLSVEEKREEKREEKKVLQRAAELPNYSSTELSDLLESRESFRHFLVEAQNILGKVFNTSDINIMVGLLDYLGMSEESILLLLAHCKRIDKLKLRAIEKYAIDLADRGIITPEALEEEFLTAEAVRSFQGQIRTLFGMKARSFTKKEEGFLRAWISYGYGIDVVTLAYEITADATGEASLPYANKILTRWHEEGWSTREQIEVGIEQEKREREGQLLTKDGQSVLGNSFDTDDFFEAALSRSFSERRED